MSGLSGFVSGVSCRLGSNIKEGQGIFNFESKPARRDTGNRPRTSGVKMPHINSIHRCTVVSIHEFGAFMQLGKGDVYKDGLLHVSCISLAGQRIECVADAVQTGATLWAKVSDVRGDEGKFSLDIRYVSQKDGKDLDTLNIKSNKLPDNHFQGLGKPKAAVPPRGAVASRAFGQDFGREDDASPPAKRQATNAGGKDSSSEDSGTHVVNEKVKKKLEKAAKKKKKAEKQAEKARKKLQKLREKKAKKKSTSSSSSNSDS